MPYKTDPVPLPQVSESSPTLTPQKFAEAAGLSLSTVWRRLRSGELPSVKVAGRRMIPADALWKLPRNRPAVFNAQHPMWRLVGAAKSGGAGPGSSDKHVYLADEASGRRK